MPDDDILPRVKSVVFDTFGAPAETLGGHTVAADVPGWDSLGHLVLVTGIEREFACRLPMEASLAVPDLDGLVALIRRSRSG